MRNVMALKIYSYKIWNLNYIKIYLKRVVDNNPYAIFNLQFRTESLFEKILNYLNFDNFDTLYSLVICGYLLRPISNCNDPTCYAKLIKISTTYLK